MIPFGAWEPDVAKFTSGISPNIVNAMPIKGLNTNDWGPMKGPAPVSGAGALPGVPQGQATVINAAEGAYQTFAGTTDKLYVLAADYTWTEIGSGYALPDGDYWSFAAFGRWLLATNVVDGLLAYDMATPAGVNPVSGAPKFRSISTIFDTLMGFSSDGDQLMARNSAINDFTVWTPNVNGAGYQPYADGDELVCGAELPGGIAVVLQRDRYSTLLRNPQLLYTKQEQAYGVGSVGHQSVVRAAGKLYFLSEDGFYATGGGEPEPIGAERINRWFLEDADGGTLAQVQGAYDNERKVVYWRYKRNSDPDTGIFSGLLGYDIQLDRWFLADVETAGILAFRTPGISLDDIDDDLDDIDRSLDSRYYLGGAPGLAIIGGDLKVQTMDGDNLAATLDTATSATPMSQLIRSCVPAYIGARSACTVQVGTNNFIGEAETWSVAQPVQPSGRAMLRARGKNVRFRVNFAAAADWTSARGVDHIDAASGGVR